METTEKCSVGVGLIKNASPSKVATGKECPSVLNSDIISYRVQ